MAYSHLPYPSNPSLEQLKVIASDTSVTIYVAPSGLDTNSGLSSTTPVFSLKKAWTVAQQYNIVGNGQLYITFAGGTYAYSDAEVPDNLYHPQGGNIIIQGDPTAVKQRYLYRVQNYSWDISRISYHGHTGTVNLTNLQAGHTHGYVAADTNMWVAISNPSLSSAGNYLYSYVDTTAGVNYSGLDDANTRSGIYGDMFFNHGYSYENVNGIYGVAQIADASTSTTDLQLIFKNTNTDPRIPAFSPYTKGAVSNGIGNSIRFSGVNNNYPENQYSKPNGYYGNSSWSGYPTRVAGDAYNTPQPILITSFPAVIQKSGAKPVFTIVGSQLKAIRNFMVVASQFAVPDANASKTKALNALYPGEEHSPETTAGTWLQALLQAENATVGIRHLGVYHAEFGIVATNSTIYTYTESDVSAVNTNTTGVHGAGSIYNYAKLAHPDNTPVLNLVNVRYGIHAHRSDVQIGYESNRHHSASKQYFSEQGCFIQSSFKGIVADYNSDVTIRSAVINSVKPLPRFAFTLRVPVFAGSTLTSGNTYSFMYPTSWSGSELTVNSNQAFQNGYAAGAVVMRCVHPQFGAGVVGVTLGYITNIAGGGTFAYTSGQYTTTHSVSGSPVPAYWQWLNVYGYRVGDLAGLSFDRLTTFNAASSSAFAQTGYTLEFMAFSDNETTRAGGTFEIGYKSFRSSAAGGQIITGTTTGSGTESLNYPLSNYLGNEWYVNNPSTGYDATVGVYGASKLTIRKNLILTAADNPGVMVSNASSLQCGYSVNLGRTDVDNGTGNIISDQARSSESGSILMNGVGNIALLLRFGSYANLSNVFIKNYKPSTDFAGFSDVFGIYAAQNCTVDLSDNLSTDSCAVVVFPPYNTNAWNSIQNAVGGTSVSPSGVLFANGGSRIMRMTAYTVTTAYDAGGLSEQSTARDLGFIQARGGSILGGMQKGTTTDNDKCQISHIWSVDNSLTPNIMTRQPGWKYNQPTTSTYYRWWQITGTRPTTGGGRTAGVWSGAGTENVRRVGWVMTDPFAWGAVPPPVVSSAASGLTYSGTAVTSGLNINASIATARVNTLQEDKNSYWFYNT